MADGTHFADFPPWELMNFSNDCAIWGDWLGIVLTPDPSNPSSLIGPASFTGLDLFVASLPANGTDYQGNRTYAEIFSRISEWYTYNMYYDWNGSDDFTEGYYTMNPKFLQNVVAEPANNCVPEFCSAMAYTGNVDLTGVGVWISYLVEALLVTLYLFAYTTSRIRRYFKERRHRGSPDPSSAYPAVTKTPTGARAVLAKLSLTQRTIDSFRGSLSGFLSSAMLISIAVICASLYLNRIGLEANFTNVISHNVDADGASTNLQFPFHGSKTYDMILSFLASTFSVFPVLLLYAMKGSSRGSSGSGDPKTEQGTESEHESGSKHNLWIRRSAIVVIWILYTVQVFLSSRGNPDYNTRHDPDQEANIDPCNHRGGTEYWLAMHVAEVIVIVAPLLWIIVTVFLVTGFGSRAVVNNRWIRRWRTIWRLGVAWVNLVIMWAVFFYFAQLRVAIIETAGGTDEQNDWAFGQVLALATWVPVVAEFLYIFIWGIEDGLDSRLPSGFEVQRVNLLSDMDDSVGPDPYEIQQGGPRAGNEKLALSPAVEPVPSTESPGQYFGGGQTAAAADGHYLDPEGQIMPHISYDNNARGY